MVGKLSTAEADARASLLGYPKGFTAAAIFSKQIKGVTNGAVMWADQDSFETFLAKKARQAASSSKQW